MSDPIRLALRLELAEYADGKATFENELGNVSLTIPPRGWDVLSRTTAVRIIVEPVQ